MATLVTITRLLADFALGLWLGAMVFFSFVTAPRVFSILDSDDAGRVVSAIFPQYYLLGVAFGAVALVAGIGVGLLHRFDFFLGMFFVGVVLAVGAVGYARWVLLPKMDAAGDDGFARYHQQSVALNAVAVLGVAVAFAAMHF